MQRNRNRRLRRGFTLIEIMVVVLIIGLLATLVGQNVIRALFTGKTTKAKSDISSLVNAVTMYKAQKGTWPDSIEELAEVDETGQSFLQGNRVPKDPWGNDYYYEPPRSGSSEFEIISYGSDGAQGGEGEDADISSLTMNDEEPR
ncbi:MAG: type II secretion system protein GspG [Planctomycetota bacterium]|nr:MAG: type II secretion system protein GspG [Planctomycetota bacterium]